MSDYQYPRIGSLQSRVLARLLRTERLTHRTFDTESRTYRLAAYIHKLREKGWPIRSQTVTERTNDPTGRNASYVVYFLLLTTIRLAGKQGRDFAFKVFNWERKRKERKAATFPSRVNTKGQASRKGAKKHTSTKSGNSGKRG